MKKLSLEFAELARRCSNLLTTLDKERKLVAILRHELMQAGMKLLSVESNAFVLSDTERYSEAGRAIGHDALAAMSALENPAKAFATQEPKP